MQFASTEEDIVAALWRADECDGRDNSALYSREERTGPHQAGHEGSRSFHNQIRALSLLKAPIMINQAFILGC